MKFDSSYLKMMLKENGASLVGFGDLSEFVDDDLVYGISIALKLPKQVIKNIANGPTREYFDTYNMWNSKLNELAITAAEYIEKCGYKAFAQTTDAVREYGFYETRMPHKTVATNSGIGWIGKDALLVTKEFGSAIRLTSVLTNAPINCDKPIKESKCGACTKCKDVCPGKAIKGKLWNVDINRKEMVDILKCRTKARKLAMDRIGEEITLCSKCIEACPYTRRYIEEKN